MVVNWIASKDGFQVGIARCHQCDRMWAIPVDGEEVGIYLKALIKPQRFWFSWTVRQGYERFVEITSSLEFTTRKELDALFEQELRLHQEIDRILKAN